MSSVSLRAPIASGRGNLGGKEDLRFFAEFILSADSSVAEFTLSGMRFFAALRMTQEAKCSFRMTLTKGSE